MDAIFVFVLVREQLRGRLELESVVQFALLFGSRAGGGGREDSDWDLAVYLDGSIDAAERFRQRLRLTALLEDIATVDVVVLNDADSLLGQEALQGELLVVKDRGNYVDYFVRTMAEAEDQRFFDEILARGRDRRLAEGTFGQP